MSRETVREVIIARMLALYPPPRHLREDAQARAQALAEYEQVLAGFDRDTLEKGWVKAVAENPYWAWPSAGEIAAACRLLAPRPPATSDQEARREQALALADAYAAHYLRSSQLSRLARREGWEPRLAQYVRAAAWVQGQLLCGLKQISWDAALLAEREKFHSSQEAFAAYRQRVAPAIERGRIRVHVPVERVRQWRERAGRQLEECDEGLPAHGRELG